MSNKRNPTNSDIIKRLDTMQGAITDVVKDVETLKEWRIALLAVEEYKRREGTAPVAEKGSNEWLNRELVKMFGIALSIIAGLVVLAQALAK